MKLKLSSKITNKKKAQKSLGWFEEKNDKILLIFISVFVLLSRWFGKSEYLFASDSGLYGLALQKYDLSIHQPHPPGYPLYILLAKPFYLLTGDANLALVIVSILFSVLAVWVVFTLAKEIFDRKVAWVSIALLVTAPMVWFHGQVGLNYISDIVFSSLVALYSYRSVFNKKTNQLADLYWSSIFLAIGGGFRPTLILFMGPLWLWSVLKQRSWKEFIKNTAIVFAVFSLWFVPQIYLSGGLEKTMRVFDSMFLHKDGVYSFSVFAAGFAKMWYRAKVIWNNFLLNFGVVSLAVIVSMFLWLIPDEDNKKIDKNNLLFWGLWIVPAMIFYLVIIFNMPGYLLVLIPAFTLLLSKAVIKLVDSLVKAYSAANVKRNSSNILFLLVLLSVSFNVWNYYKTDEIIKLQKNTHQAIRASNSLWSNLDRVIHEEFNPQTTIIGIEDSFVIWGLSQFEYYFPEYPVYSKIFWGIDNPEDKKWYLAHNHHLYLCDELEVYQADTRLIVVTGTWAKPSGDYSSVALGTIGEPAYLSYYDLFSLEIRTRINNLPDINVYGIGNND
ncbi:MAG: glycosyltransferase family 39 protein [Patescibacteria group bacterium]|nr:glycosyltransferase family 39 protein [Patescibacteria group bacterium]